MAGKRQVAADSKASKKQSKPPPPPQAITKESILSFGPALQSLIVTFWKTAAAEGMVSTEESRIMALQHLFMTLGHEMGHIDGVARISGVSREDMLKLLSRSFMDGKSDALQQHRKAQDDLSTPCECEGSKLLTQELEFN